MRQCQTANISTLRPWYLRFVWHSNQQSRLKKGPRRNANTLKKESRWMPSTMNLVGSLDFACWHSCHVELPMVEATILGIAAWHTKTRENFESEPQETPIFPFFQHLRLSGLPWIYGTCPKAGKDDFYACQTDRPKREKSGLSSLSGDGWRWIKWDRLLSFYAWEVFS